MGKESSKLSGAFLKAVWAGGAATGRAPTSSQSSPPPNPKVRAPLRDLNPSQIKARARRIQRNPLYLILDNVYDTYNVGGFFRLADAVAAQKLILTGTTSTPPDNKIRRSSVGTVHAVEWEYYPTVQEALDNLKKQTPNLFSIAVELTPQAQEYTIITYPKPLALIFGNETTGVSQSTLKSANLTVQLPMYGINDSLNVVVSAGIISYWVLYTWKSNNTP